MEQKKENRGHLERVLLLCGQQNAGKSRLLRQMLGDRRLGGEVPTSPKVQLRGLSRDRCLAVRFTSPHENGETPARFYEKIGNALSSEDFQRVNYASAIQPGQFKKMPGIVEVCEGLISEFRPERIRVVVLAPDQLERDTSQLTTPDIDRLRRLDIEVVSIDARRSSHPAEPGNIRILADYFDFS